MTRNRGQQEEPSPTRSARRHRWSAGALLLAAALFAGLGLYRVRPGEVALRPGGGDTAARVLGEGWHWRPPFLGSLRRLPSEPIALQRDLRLESGQDLLLVASVSGRFGVAEGREARWFEAAGWQPFVDGLWSGLENRLSRRLADIEPSQVFHPDLRARLGDLAAVELEKMGVRAESLAVELSPELNAAATARVREKVARLARPTGAKILVVGWDGADWLMIRPLLRAGRLPNLARLIERGVSGELRSQMPLLSPLIWTTIATGRPVLEHGIADFLVQDPESGALVPISSASRKVHALWTLTGAFGLRTDVVGWWATWPAEAIQGTLVSDRVAYQLFEVEDSSNEGKVHPPEAWSAIEAELISAETIGWDEIRRFVEIDKEEFDRLWESLPPDRRQEEKINHLRKILATTRSYHSILLSLLADQADLTLAYYEGTDTVGHLFARYLAPRMAGVTAEEVQKFGSALPKFYAYADELLGELLEAADPDTYVLLISDHGFFTGSARPASDPSDFASGAPQWHRLHGVLVAAGPGLQSGKIDGATVLDIAPTVLALLGLPVPQDMPGRVLTELLPPAAPTEAPRRLASYEILPRSAPARFERSPELDRERLRELAALGYISTSASEETAAEAAVGPASSAQGQDLQGMATEAYNRGRILQRQGDYAGAFRQYRTAIERMPGFGPAYASLAQIESLQGRHCRAFEILVRGLFKSGNLPLASVTGLVDEAAQCGRLDEAERALAELHESYKKTSAYHAALGLLHQNTNRSETALEHYRKALEIDPFDQLASERTVAVLRQQGREQEARDFLDRAFARASGRVEAMNQLAVVALRQGWAPQAEGMLRQVLESDPGNPGILANLAASLMQQRRLQEALEVMQQAVQREPDNARNHFNLGAMLAEQGRFAEALASFNAAAEKGLRNARVHVAAAKMHFRLGDRARAARELEKALEIEPQNPEATRLLEILRQG